jgi:acyl-coenzyme A thioesterase PaaI-like protein
MTATDKDLEPREKQSSRSGMRLQDLIATNASAGLNRLAGFDVTAAENGAAEIVMEWNDDLTQYAGHLHAGNH